MTGNRQTFALIKTNDRMIIYFIQSNKHSLFSPAGADCSSRRRDTHYILLSPRGPKKIRQR